MPQNVDLLTKTQAQENMGNSVFVAHISNPEIGFKYSRIGNIESHDSDVYNASEFWYNRLDPAYDTGWFLFKTL